MGTNRPQKSKSLSGTQDSYVELGLKFGTISLQHLAVTADRILRTNISLIFEIKMVRNQLKVII